MYICDNAYSSMGPNKRWRLWGSDTCTTTSYSLGGEILDLDAGKITSTMSYARAIAMILSIGS